MKHLLRRIVCMFVAVTLVALSAGVTGTAAPAMAMTGSSDAVVAGDKMSCGDCGAMKAASMGCTQSQCAMTGIVPAVNVTAMLARAVFRPESMPTPRGRSYRPAIFPA